MQIRQHGGTIVAIKSSKLQSAAQFSDANASKLDSRKKNKDCSARMQEGGAQHRGGVHSTPNAEAKALQIGLLIINAQNIQTHLRHTPTCRQVLS
jgi:hypothetical protein